MCSCPVETRSWSRTSSWRRSSGKLGRSDLRSWEEIKEGIDYIRETPEVRDVLLSGGDPLMVSDEFLEKVIREVRKIKHVQIVRLGSRTPVVLPSRITASLVKMLRK